MTNLRVLGSSDWLPVQGNDCSSYIIGEHLLVDTGWAAPTRLLLQGFDLQQLTTVLFTHMHTDHIMGLPQLLMNWRIMRGNMQGLTIAGPCEMVRAAVEAASAYVFDGDAHAPFTEGLNLVELQPHDTLETEEFGILCMPSLHALPGRCYRIISKKDGHAVGLTGDTAYQSEYADFFMDVDLLVHEHSWHTKPMPEVNKAGHSNAAIAGRVARESHARRLALTHSRGDIDASIALAQTECDCPVTRLWNGNVVQF